MRCVFVFLQYLHHDTLAQQLHVLLILGLSLGIGVRGCVVWPHTSTASDGGSTSQGSLLCDSHGGCQHAVVGGKVVVACRAWCACMHGHGLVPILPRRCCHCCHALLLHGCMLRLGLGMCLGPCLRLCLCLCMRLGLSMSLSPGLVRGSGVHAARGRRIGGGGVGGDCCQATEHAGGA